MPKPHGCLQITVKGPRGIPVDIDKQLATRPGKHTKDHGTSPFFMGKTMENHHFSMGKSTKSPFFYGKIH
jgi:hypothetical protein